MGLISSGFPVPLIFLNAAVCPGWHLTDMAQPSTISDRLLAHARLCREIALATSNEVTAGALERLAVDCIAAAREADAAPQGQVIPSLSERRRATA